MKETVYIYNINDKETLRKLQVALLRLKIRIKLISPEMLPHKVGYIAGLDDFEADDVTTAALPAVTDEVMLLKGFNNARVDTLLAALRGAGIPRIKLKAVLTDTNKDWYFCDLCRELLREHQELNQCK